MTRGRPLEPLAIAADEHGELRVVWVRLHVSK